MKARVIILALFCLTVSWYYAASYWAESGRGFPVEFYPFWNASRAILHGSDPYGEAIAQQNQIAAYGSPAASLGVENEQRFAYPAYATVLLLPLGYLPFPLANGIAFVIFAALTILSVGWLRRRWDWTTVLYCAFALSGFPIIYDLRSRQPALLFFGLAVAGLALVRSGWLVPAGICAAVSLGKPHLALSVTLVELIWALAEWRVRRKFAFSFLASALGLFALSSILSPGWTAGWLSTLRAYTHYNKPSIVVSLFDGITGMIVSVVIIAALVAVLWLSRRSEVLLQAALSVAVIYLLVPYANYNAVILLIPTIWLLDNAAVISPSGDLDALMLAAVRVAIVLFLGVNALGAVLMHVSRLGRSIAWVLPSLATHALLFCLVGAMVAHYITLLSSRGQPAKVAHSYISE